MSEIKKEWMAGMFETPNEVAQAYAMFYELTHPGAGGGIDYEVWYESIGNSSRVTPGEPYDTYAAWRDLLGNLIEEAVPASFNRDIWGLLHINEWPLVKISEHVGMSRDAVRDIIYYADGEVSRLIVDQLFI